jgi:hypothetical protein
LSGSAISVAKATTPSRPDWTSLVISATPSSSEWVREDIRERSEVRGQRSEAWVMGHRS